MCFSYCILLLLCFCSSSASFLKSERVQVANKEYDIQYHTPEYYNEVYEKIYTLLKEGNKERPNYYIQFSPNPWAGFANSFRGMYSSMLYALINGMKFRVDWNVYFNVMSESMQFLKYNEIEMNRGCPRMGSAESILEQNQFISPCIFVSPYADTITQLLKKPTVGQKLVDLGLFDAPPTDVQVRQLFTRALFRLNDNLLQKSSSVINRFKNRTSIGLQIRTGGQLANHKEDTIFFSLDKMYRVYSILDTLLEGIHEEVVIFLATDSKEIYQLLSSKYHLPIIMASYYSVGHSADLRGYGNIDYINRAMIDLQVLSNCDYLLTTFTSSFGNTASYLSHSLNKIIMNYKD